MMKIRVLVKTKSKAEGIEKNNDDSNTVRVNVPPIDGKANKRVIELVLVWTTLVVVLRG